MKQSTFSAVMANSIKNLLQGYTQGIRITAILILLLMGVSNAWAASEGSSWYDWASSENVYFDNTNSSYSNVSMLIGRQWTYGGDGIGSSGVNFTKVENTNNLYHAATTWNHYNTLLFIDETNWGWEGNKVTQRYTYAKNYTNTNNININGTELFYAASSSKGSTLNHQDLSSYTALNYTQTVQQHLSTDGGSNYAVSTTALATVTISSYELNSKNTTASSSGTIASGSSSTTCSAARTATVTYTVTDVKSGYTFVGWYDGTTQKSTATTYNALKATGAKTITARFKENTYTVTVKNDGHGTTTPSGAQSNVGEVTGLSIKANPVANYEFVNWTITSGSGSFGSATSASTIFKPTSAATIQANFRSTATNSLTVVAGANIESVTGSTDPVTLGNTYNITATPKTGYTFSTWTANPAANATFGSATTTNTTVTVKNGSVTVTASATENMSTLTTSNKYDAGNPSYAVPSATVSKIGIATTATVTATAASNGYTFTGWTLTNCTRTDGGAADATSITVRSNGDGKAATVVANYAEDCKTAWVLAHSIDGFNTSSHPFVKKSGESTGKVAYVSLDLAANTAYTFKVKNGDKWYGNNNSDEQYWIKATAENWEFYSDAGDCHMKSSVAGTYTFKIDFSGTYPKVSVQFPTAYTVTYGVGTTKGTTFVNTDPSITSGSLVLASTSITFSKGETKAGYTWKGWYNNAAGTGDAITTEETYTSENRTDNISIYACYDLVPYTIIYNLNGGSGTMTPTSYNIETETFTLPTPTKIGYTFAGWHTKSDFSDAEVTQIAKGSTGNKTLYAQWRPNVSITGTYHFFPGERITLNITTPDDGVKFTYQWQKLVGSDWTDIADATTTTYTKDAATIADAGHYRCVVSSEGYCDAIDEYDVKCLQLYVYYDNKSDVFNAPLKKVDGATATIDVELQNAGYTYYFKITDGCGSWYGFDGDIHSEWCTKVPMNADAYCGLKTTKFGTYIFTVDHSYLTDDSKLYPVVTVTYPSALQEANKVIYLDNHVLDWTNSNNAEGKNKIYYRIGRSDHNNKHAMTLVPGTANLYKVTTSKYDKFDVWHIANNGCWSDGNSIYKTNTGGGWAATQATAFETLPVTLAAVTVTPTTFRSVGGDENNNNCKFYNYDITEGMKTWNAEVIEPTNGTITVKYIHHDGTAVNNFTSGNRYLAHTCLLTITAEPKTGYSLQSLTVNGEAFTSGNTYTLTSDATIEAAWTPVTYTITYENLDGATANNPGEYTIESNITLNEPTNAPEGCTFVGWYENADYTGNKVTQINGATGNKTLYAKWAYTVQWSVNGEIVKTETVAYGANASAPDIAPPYPCDADVFVGWIKDELEMNETDRPADEKFVTNSPVITENITFYAVFANYEN